MDASLSLSADPVTPGLGELKRLAWAEQRLTPLLSFVREGWTEVRHVPGGAGYAMWRERELDTTELAQLPFTPTSEIDAGIRFTAT